jgi:hypothetical protein
MPTEKDIEQYIRFPEQLSPESIRRIELALEENEELELLANWFSRYYQFVDDSGRRTPARPPQIELVPMKIADSKQRTMFVLAAKTEDPKTEDIETVRTFVSDRYRTLMRVLYDRKRNLTRIHVVSDHVGKQDIVLIYFPDNDLHLVSKPGGKAEVPEEQIGKELVESWSSCRILLPVSRSKINHLGPEFNGYFPADSGGGISTIEVEQDEDEVNIITGREDGYSESGILLLYSKDESTLWRIRNHRATLPPDKVHNRELTLFIYNEL